MSEATWATLAGAVVGAMLGWIGALVQGVVQQDRESMRKLRGAAKALLIDVERIDEELKRKRATGIMPWTGDRPVPAPSVHPWTEGLIPQVADDSPELVGGFMRLERALRALEEAAEKVRSDQQVLSDLFERADRMNAEAKATFFGGTYDPLTDTFLPPEGNYQDPPDGGMELVKLAAAGDAVAEAKLEMLDSRETAARSLAEHRVREQEAMSHVIALERRLIPLAYRKSPTLMGLVRRTLFRVPEDAELARLAEETLLREHGYEPREPQSPPPHLPDRGSPGASNTT